MADAARTVEGHISLHPKGFGFIRVEEDEALTVFVPPPALNRFLHGDRASARVREQPDGRLMAKDLKLLERKRRRVFGTVLSHRGKLHLEIDRRIANSDWPLKGEVEIGDTVIAEINGDRLQVMEVVPSNEQSLQRVLVRYGIETAYPPSCIEQLDQLPKITMTDRRDLRDRTTITIDAATSKDLDDALTVEPAAPDGALRVMINIADVDALVSLDTPIDQEARRRGTSVYLAGRVVPMLPPQLSEQGLSLLPDEDRPTLTAELRIDPDGNVTATDLYQSMIRSDYRLDYDSVARFLEQGDTKAVPVGAQDTLRWLRTAESRLAVVRSGRGGIQIHREEASITINEQGEPTDLNPRRDNSAHTLIERLMVAANEAVARWLVERGLPGIFRVHPEPGEEHVEALVESARHFGFEAGLVAPLSPKALAAFEAQFRGTAAEPSMERIFTRVLGPARYTVEPGSHFGLAAPLYLHFTSPIRRYSDLAVHRLIKSYLAGERDRHAGDPAYEQLSEHLNEAYLNAAKAERERFSMVAARLFQNRVGEKLEGTIIAIKTFGLVVQLTGAGASGTIAMDELAGGPFSLDRARQRLVGKSRAYQIGAKLAVEVIDTNEELGRIELAPV